MKLSVGERLVLLSILPGEGDFLTIKIIRQLRERLSFTEEEHKQYQFVQAEGRVSWQGGNDSKPIEIGDKANEVIVAALKKLDEAKLLRDEHYTLYEKFVEKHRDGS